MFSLHRNVPLLSSNLDALSNLLNDKGFKITGKKSPLSGKKSPLLDLYLRDFLDYFRKSLIFHLNTLYQLRIIPRHFRCQRKRKYFINYTENYLQKMN